MRCPACQASNDESAHACFECGATLLAPIVRGTVIAARYEILRPLGKGGMGVVYLAHDRHLDETIALKVLRTDVADAEGLTRRFRAEIRLARRVTHPNVCRIYDYGEDGPRRFISMAHVDGVDLRRLLAENGPFPPAEALDVSLRVAEALSAIHEAGIVHRDLKTANIMRDANGAIRVMDFGIAKNIGGASAASLTGTGHVVGSPESMSPEQWTGQKADVRSDVYALGVVVFEVFAGRPLFTSDSVTGWMWQHLHAPPPLEALPEAVRGIVGRALAKQPEDRFQSAAAVAAELRAVRALLPDAPRAPLGAEVSSADLEPLPTGSGGTRVVPLAPLATGPAATRPRGTLAAAAVAPRVVDDRVLVRDEPVPEPAIATLRPGEAPSDRPRLAGVAAGLALVAVVGFALADRLAQPDPSPPPTSVAVAPIPSVPATPVPTPLPSARPTQFALSATATKRPSRPATRGASILSLEPPRSMPRQASSLIFVTKPRPTESSAE